MRIDTWYDLVHVRDLRVRSDTILLSFSFAKGN